MNKKTAIKKITQLVDASMNNLKQARELADQYGLCFTVNICEGQDRRSGYEWGNGAEATYVGEPNEREEPGGWSWQESSMNC